MLRSTCGENVIFCTRPQRLWLLGHHRHALSLFTLRDHKAEPVKSSAIAGQSSWPSSAPVDVRPRPLFGYRSRSAQPFGKWPSNVPIQDVIGEGSDQNSGKLAEEKGDVVERSIAASRAHRAVNSARNANITDRGYANPDKRDKQVMKVALQQREAAVGPVAECPEVIQDVVVECRDKTG
jgi:hypothetical protein